MKYGDGTTYVKNIYSLEEIAEDTPIKLTISIDGEELIINTYKK